MRNDARPVGEKVKEIDEHARQERGMAQGPREQARDTSDRKPFITDHDTGDEEPARKNEPTMRKTM